MAQKSHAAGGRVNPASIRPGGAGQAETIAGMNRSHFEQTLCEFFSHGGQGLKKLLKPGKKV
jgi:hypothetical protein